MYIGTDNISRKLICHICPELVRFFPFSVGLFFIFNETAFLHYPPVMTQVVPYECAVGHAWWYRGVDLGCHWVVWWGRTEGFSWSR